jgi:threonine aldolase
MPNTKVDLRSDTVTQPTPAMREAMARAAVGDDVMGEDPTVNALQDRAAALFGKEAALFVPTGTMANLTAILAQTRPGDAIILSEDAHPYNFESANIAMVGGLLTKLVRAEYGVITCEDVAARIIQTNDHHFAPTTLVTIENTSNRGGGAIYPIETVAAIGALARERGLRFHIDGARIFNAVVETGVAPKTYASHADTLSFCLSKGLGSPAGSLVVGDAKTIDRVHRFRKMLGGGMRQAGILAAAGLYALDHHVERLRDDHARARRFREGIERIPGLELPLPSPTNMVYVRVQEAHAFAQRLAQEGVRVLPTAPDRLRAVFHLDVTGEGVEHAIEVFERAAECQRCKMGSR